MYGIVKDYLNIFLNSRIFYLIFRIVFPSYRFIPSNHHLPCPFPLLGADCPRLTVVDV